MSSFYNRCMMVSRAQQEARWHAYWVRQMEAFRQADEAVKREVRDMCERIEARIHINPYPRFDGDPDRGWKEKP